jgi:hypothetical protein
MVRNRQKSNLKSRRFISPTARCLGRERARRQGADTTAAAATAAGGLLLPEKFRGQLAPKVSEKLLDRLGLFAPALDQHQHGAALATNGTKSASTASTASTARTASTAGTASTANTTALFPR